MVNLEFQQTLYCKFLELIYASYEKMYYIPSLNNSLEPLDISTKIDNGVSMRGSLIQINLILPFYHSWIWSYVLFSSNLDFFPFWIYFLSSCKIFFHRFFFYSIFLLRAPTTLPYNVSPILYVKFFFFFLNMEFTTSWW